MIALMHRLGVLKNYLLTIGRGKIRVPETPELKALKERLMSSDLKVYLKAIDQIWSIQTDEAMDLLRYTLLEEVRSKSPRRGFVNAVVEKLLFNLDFFLHLKAGEKRLVKDRIYEMIDVEGRAVPYAHNAESQSDVGLISTRGKAQIDLLRYGTISKLFYILLGTPLWGNWLCLQKRTLGQRLCYRSSQETSSVWF